MNTLDAIKKRSSTRAYTNGALSEDEITTLVRAGLHAPTATNRRELHFTVLKKDNPLLSELEEEKNRLWGVSKPEANFFYDAPTVIVISGESAFKWSAVDAGIAVENISLAAEELGLGSVIIGCIHDALYSQKKEYFEKALSFPDGYSYQIAIAVGRKASKKEPHTFDESSQVTCL